MKEEKEKQERKVIHLHLLNEDKHVYYGSVAQLFEDYSKEELGISYTYFRKYQLTEDNPFINNKCVIRKGLLITKPKQKI